MERRPPINTNWSIDTTAKSVLTLSTGILAAALSDNVQVLAIQACEAYGVILPMCLEVCMKVEQLAKRRHTSHIISNIGVAIGFTPGDAADHLASSDAGVRFLALAAALLSFGSAFEAAKCLYELLHDTTSERQLMPTIAQLKHLFVALEKKIACSGFMDQLEGWRIVLHSEALGLLPLFTITDAVETQADPSDEDTAISTALEQEPFEHSIQSNNVIETSRLSRLNIPPLFTGLWNNLRLPYLNSNETKTQPSQPATSTGESQKSKRKVGEKATLPTRNLCQQGYLQPQCISKLLKGMSEIYRIGEGSFMTIRTGPSNAIWTVAFIRWCLGIEPSIRSVAMRKLLLHQPNSRVCVEIGQPDTTIFSVRTFKSVKGIHQLLWESRSLAPMTNSPSWAGMVSIQTYFVAWLEMISSHYRLHHLENTLLWLASQVTDRITSSRSERSPFASSTKLVDLVARYYMIEDPFRRLREMKPHNFHSMYSGSDSAQLVSISELYLDILASSMIENVHSRTSSDVFLQTKSSYLQGHPNRDVDGVVHFLSGQTLPGYTFSFGYNAAERLLLYMLGCNPGDKLPLASSSKGQVEYLSVLETMSPGNHCIYQRRIFPGDLQYQGQRYAYITGDGYTSIYIEPPTAQSSDYSSDPNTFLELENGPDHWMVSLNDDFLATYYVPDVNLYHKINIRGLLDEFSETVSVTCSGSGCQPTADCSTDLVYCKTIDAVLSDSQPQTVRVVRAPADASKRLYILAAILERMGRPNGVNLMITGSACVSCAYNAVDHIMSRRRLQRDRVQVVIFI